MDNVTRDSKDMLTRRDFLVKASKTAAIGDCSAAASFASVLKAYLKGNGQEHVLDQQQTDWRRWPKKEIVMPRTSSNYPCPWASK